MTQAGTFFVPHSFTVRLATKSTETHKEENYMRKHLLRLEACLLALVLAMGCCLCAVAEESYPTAWDLTEIYADEEAWLADYDRVMEMIQHYEEYRGTLNTAQGIYDYFQFSYLGELTRIQNRLALYAYLGYNLNPADPAYSMLLARLSMMSSVESQLSAFVDEEIFALPLEKRQEIFSDPLLEPWAYALRNYVDPEHEPLGEEAAAVLAILSPALGRSEGVFNILDSVDMPDPVITMPDGTEAALTSELYTQIIYGGQYDREFMALCNETILTKPVSYVNTFAALLDANASENWAFAQIDGYETSREAALSASDIDPAIYDMLIAAARQGAPDYQRYLNVHRLGLGLDVQYPFDMGTYVSDYAVEEIPYADAVNEVRDALSVLGEDYGSILDELVQGGHLDVYPSETKTTGAFSMTIGDEFLPYMLFNYVGYSDDVSALAHELGHAIYSTSSARAQETFYDEPTTFTHEVASITNELLYYNYKMENAATDDERMFYLENLLSMFSGTFFGQALYAEFEDELYKTVEAGCSLDAEALSDRWVELYADYRGDAVKSFPDSRYQWAIIPHFYYNYYVYQYATSATYAAAVCQRILSGEEGATEAYLAFLQLGCSMPPADLLAVAGVDPLSEDTYQNVLDYYGGLVDEYEALVNAKLAE